MDSLWGDEFKLPKTQEIVKSVKEKTRKVSQNKEKTDEQKLRSRVIDINDKLSVIKNNVYKILGGYETNTSVIYNKEDFIKYIDASILNGVIAIDTETNNTLDTTTCKIMGLCLYTPGQKQAYIPINHVDPQTKEKLSNQLTEDDVREQLSRLGETKIIMHNAPFDYQVIGFTCGIWLNVYWDTRVASKLLNENEESKLKVQYVSKIDSSIEKYNINSFFENIEYALVPPEVFSLYAATDSYMTYRLYLYQKDIFELPENKDLLNLFMSVEMPIDIISADMERNGVNIDTDYANRLKSFYDDMIADIDKDIADEVSKLQPILLQWRLTPEANVKPKKAKVSKDGSDLGKSKNEQLSDPVNVASPLQLSILLYDVLKFPPVSKDKQRSTDSEVLTELSKKYDFELGKKILRKRELNKLLSTYIEAIPKQISPRDNRLHAKFDTMGTVTGRFSSSNPNL